MENIRLFLRLYFSPASAMSGILDRGNWLFAAMMVILTSVLFFYGVNARLDKTYRIPSFNEFYQPNFDSGPDSDSNIAEYGRASSAYEKANEERPKVPLIGDIFFKLFSFDPTRWFVPILSISIFYVPAVVLLMCFVGGVGNFGIVVRRDYMSLATCTLMSWAAAHLPFGIAGLLLGPAELSPLVYLVFWAGSGLVFGALMLVALRTVFGTDLVPNLVTVGSAWLSFGLGALVFSHLSPWIFSPFLSICILMLLVGYFRSEVGGMGNSFRQRQNFKRFLHTATINPRDADAHVQLGLIYKQRRQESLAREHFQKAYEIDQEEVDANYELGRIARAEGELQQALDHFAVVVEQNDKHSVSEVWREIGATYLAAGMPAEAREALEKFVERRSLDPEGLYHLGMVFKAQGDQEKAKEKFVEVIEAAKIVPSYQRREAALWRKLAQKEL